MAKLNIETCRICLSNAVVRDITELRFSKNDDEKNYVELMSFCLGIHIQVTPATKHRKVCTKCYNKILSFYKFKTLALKNDQYFQSLGSVVVKLEVFVREQAEDDKFLSGNEDVDADTYYNDKMVGADFREYGNGVNIGLDIKEETIIKTEVDDQQYLSEDELLSNLKVAKYEEDVKKEVKDVVVKKKRGRPKSKQVLGVKSREMCPECGKEVRDLRDHREVHLPLDKRKSYKCSDCEKIFYTYSAKTRHYQTKHLGIKQHCDICSKDVVSLKAHNNVIHNRDALRWQCEFCSRKFSCQSLLNEHRLKHTKELPHECHICHKKFRIKLLLTSHIRGVHEGEKTHLCQFCPKSFFKKTHLESHLRSHTKERPYECKECNKFFASSYTLKNHQNLHTGLRKYECTMCDMTFTQNGNMAKHLLVHTKEKKYKCKYCEVKFGRQDHRKRHEYTAHEKHFTVLNLTTTNS